MPLRFVQYYQPDDASTGASAGQIKSVKLMLGQCTELYSASYQYDASGRLWKVTANGTTYTYGYKDDTDLVESVTGGGMDTTFGYETDTNRLSTIDVSAASTALYGAELGYHANDQRQSETVSQKQTDSSTSNTTLGYVYNDQDQLTTVTSGGQTQSSYSYDGVGNRTISGAGALNDLNQYSGWSYDGRGNLTDDGSHTYAWDAEDHLTAAENVDHSAKVGLGYDSAGRLAWEKTYTWDAGLNDGDGGWKLGQYIKLAWDGYDLAAEFLVQPDHTEALWHSYTWGLGHRLLAETVYNVQTGAVSVVYNVICDGSGNVVSLIDATTGAVAATYRYDAYGNTVDASGPAADVCNIGWQGLFTVRSLNILYAIHRWYDPVSGRWLNRDPIEEEGGVNMYVYCRNDPINMEDRSGLEGEAALRELRSFTKDRPEKEQRAWELGLAAYDVCRAIDFSEKSTRYWRQELVYIAQLERKRAGAPAILRFFDGGPLDVDAGRVSDATRRQIEGFLAYYARQVAAQRAELDDMAAQYRAMNVGTMPSLYKQRASDEASWEEARAGSFAELVDGAGMLAYFRTVNQGMQSTGDEVLIITMFSGSIAGTLSSAGERALAENAVTRVLNPDARTVLENVVQAQGARLSADPALAKTVLTEAEYAAGQGSVAIARIQYGNALERLVAQAIERDPLYRTILKHLGGAGRADFMGIGGSQGLLFELTTQKAIAAHLSRWYGAAVDYIAYSRPLNFLVFP